MTEIKVKKEFSKYRLMAPGKKGRQTAMAYQELGELSQEQLKEYFTLVLANPKKNSGSLRYVQNSLAELQDIVSGKAKPAKKKIAKPEKEDSSK